MSGWMKYDLMKMEIRVETRMIPSSDMDIDMFCALPDGTELILIDVAPFGMSLSMTGITMSDLVRESIVKWGNDTGETMMGHSSIIYLLPEDYAPDPDQIVNAEFSKLGMRHGREGSPMFSESLLRTKHEDTWHDGAYAAYVAAYKLGSGRKGN